MKGTTLTNEIYNFFRGESTSPFPYAFPVGKADTVRHIAPLSAVLASPLSCLELLTPFVPLVPMGNSVKLTRF